MSLLHFRRIPSLSTKRVHACSSALLIVGAVLLFRFRPNLGYLPPNFVSLILLVFRGRFSFPPRCISRYLLKIVSRCQSVMFSIQTSPFLMFWNLFTSTATRNLLFKTRHARFISFARLLLIIPRCSRTHTTGGNGRGVMGRGEPVVCIWVAWEGVFSVYGGWES